MAADKISFVDKETFQTSPLAEKNKATAGNYNEIKTVVNSHADDIDMLLEKVEPTSIAISDEVTDIEVGNAKTTFRIIGAKTLTEVRANVNEAPTGSGITIDINKNGGSILSTKLTIDAGGKTSTTATIPPVISDDVLNDDDEITVDIDVIGSTTAGKGLKISLL